MVRATKLLVLFEFVSLVAYYEARLAISRNQLRVFMPVVPSVGIITIYAELHVITVYAELHVNSYGMLVLASCESQQINNCLTKVSNYSVVKLVLLKNNLGLRIIWK
jgi:hypothetical protein